MKIIKVILSAVLVLTIILSYQYLKNYHIGSESSEETLSQPDPEKLLSNLPDEKKALSLTACNYIADKSAEFYQGYVQSDSPMNYAKDSVEVFNSLGRQYLIDYLCRQYPDKSPSDRVICKYAAIAGGSAGDMFISNIHYIIYQYQWVNNALVDLNRIYKDTLYSCLKELTTNREFRN
jgi:hypothetical protein